MTKMILKMKETMTERRDTESREAECSAYSEQVYEECLDEGGSENEVAALLKKPMETMSGAWNQDEGGPNSRLIVYARSLLAGSSIYHIKPAPTLKASLCPLTRFFSGFVVQKICACIGREQEHCSH